MQKAVSGYVCGKQMINAITFNLKDSIYSDKH